MYIISSELIEEKLDSYLYVYNINTASYYSFNDTGVIVWTALKDGLSKEEIVKKLMNTYGIDDKAIANDVEEIIGDLIEQGLILIKEV